MSSYRGDVEYEVWRGGRNPDRLDPDRIWQHERDGHSAEEAAAAEMRRWSQQEQARREEQQREEEYYLQQMQEEQQRAAGEQCSVCGVVITHHDTVPCGVAGCPINSTRA